MTDRNTAHMTSTPKDPHVKLTELAERQVGKWRVSGSAIDGFAEYRSAKSGFLLADVDFVGAGTKVKVIQHISYDEVIGTLRSHYMDTAGDESTYTWQVDGQRVRVSLGDEGSDTYVKATFNDDNSEYVGTWHRANGESHVGEDELIMYTRIE